MQLEALIIWTKHFNCRSFRQLRTEIHQKQKHYHYYFKIKNNFILYVGNIALHKPTSSSSTYCMNMCINQLRQIQPNAKAAFESQLAVDGKSSFRNHDGTAINFGNCAKTTPEVRPWWLVDFEDIYIVNRVKTYGNADREYVTMSINNVYGTHHTHSQTQTHTHTHTHKHAHIFTHIFYYTHTLANVHTQLYDCSIIIAIIISIIIVNTTTNNTTVT